MGVTSRRSELTREMIHGVRSAWAAARPAGVPPSAIDPAGYGRRPTAESDQVTGIGIGEPLVVNCRRHLCLTAPIEQAPGHLA